MLTCSCFAMTSCDQSTSWKICALFLCEGFSVRTTHILARSKEAATELLAYVKAPHSWLLSADEEYERSHRDVSII